MRRIDRWAGVPICFLLTLWRRVFEPSNPRTPGPSNPQTPGPSNLLFIQTAEMGSLVLALPAVRLARETYPGAAVYFLVFANLAESVAAIELTGSNRVFTIDPSSLFTIARDTWRFIRDARRHRPGGVKRRREDADKGQDRDGHQHQQERPAGVELGARDPHRASSRVRRWMGRITIRTRIMSTTARAEARPTCRSRKARM